MFENDAFQQLLRDYPDAVFDYTKLKGLLNDVFPEDRSLRRLLLHLHELGIQDELYGTGVITNILAHRFTRLLVDDYGISEENARLGVYTWCICYGKSILGKPCELNETYTDSDVVVTQKAPQSSKPQKQVAIVRFLDRINKRTSTETKDRADSKGAEDSKSEHIQPSSKVEKEIISECSTSEQHSEATKKTEEILQTHSLRKTEEKGYYRRGDIPLANSSVVGSERHQPKGILHKQKKPQLGIKSSNDRLAIRLTIKKTPYGPETHYLYFSPADPHLHEHLFWIKNQLYIESVFNMTPYDEIYDTKKTRNMKSLYYHFDGIFGDGKASEVFRYGGQATLQNVVTQVEKGLKLYNEQEKERLAKHTKSTARAQAYNAKSFKRKKSYSSVLFILIVVLCVISGVFISAFPDSIFTIVILPLICLTVLIIFIKH